ncbi:MAG: MFS transporter [Tissierellia bacterium]|nr:MFS transporter [Tissierellia bacterium]
MFKNKKLSFSLVVILFWYSLYAYVPQLSNYAKDLGASYKLIGLIGGVYGITQTVFRIPLGLLSDKLGTKKLFVTIGIICAILNNLILYLFPKPFAIVIARAIGGIASATWVHFTTLFITYFAADESDKAIGLINTDNKIGQLAGMIVGSFVAMHMGINPIFLIGVFISTISLLINLSIREHKESPKTTKMELNDFLEVLKNKRVMFVSLLGATIQFMAYSTAYNFTPLVADLLGAKSLQLGILSMVFILPQILFSFLTGTLFSRKLGDKITLSLGFLLATIAAVITPFAKSLNQLYLLQMISGSGVAIAFSLLMSIAVRGAKEEAVTTTMSVFQTLFGIGVSLGPIILGIISDLFSLKAGFLIIGLIGIGSIISALITDKI